MLISLRKKNCFQPFIFKVFKQFKTLIYKKYIFTVPTYKLFPKTLDFRYDYENCESEPCNKMMAELEAKVTAAGFVGKVLSAGSKHYTVRAADNYKYTDPIDGSVATNQVS